ncbi:MAG: hypothetical protein SGPRY_002609 [Prymnesium sp.]
MLEMVVRTPSELNELSEEDILRTHVDEELQRFVDPTLQPLVAPAVASYVTADLLLRLHDAVVEARKNGNGCGGLTKQAALAAVVGG